MQELTPEIIEQLKTVHDNEPLMVYSDKRKNSQKFVFKAISHELMRKIRKLVKDEAIKGNLLPLELVDNFVFDECVVWPVVNEEDKLDYQVGFIPQIVKSIQEKSGFLDIDVMERPLRPSELVEVITDFEFWPDITLEEVEELKNKVPFPLFKITIDRWVFIVRPLTKGDVKVLQETVDEEMGGVTACTVWPEKVPWTEIAAGCVKILWQQILSCSSFSEECEILEL